MTRQSIVLLPHPLFFLSDGLGWSMKKRLAFDNTDHGFSLASCLISLEFNFPNKTLDLFTIEKEANDPTHPNLKFFFSLIIYSEDIPPWQTISLTAQDNVPVCNFFSEHYSKVT